MLNDLFIRNWISFHGLVTALAVGFYLTASHILRQRRHPSAAIAWVLSLVLMPYLALPLYLLIGNRKVVRQVPGLAVHAAASTHRHASHPAGRIQILAGTLSLPAVSSYDHFELHEDGSHALGSLLAVIDSASSTLDICTFIFGDDVLGQEVARHLVAKAQSGVRVRLMIDGIGVYLGGHPDLGALKLAGVKLALFVSPLKSPLPGRTNLRNHRKMVVADRQRLWMGGRNLAAEYFEGDAALMHQRSAWIDLSFELRGAIACQVQEQFNTDWNFATRERGLKSAGPMEFVLGPDSSPAQLVPSGPDQTEDTIYTLLISSCFTAQQRIMAVSPYFVPDSTLQMALTLAARRGIAVDLLLPAKSNHRLADMARHAALRELTASGARVWLAPQMVHAKAIVIDEEIAFAGSANLDGRSLFLNYEMMIAFYQRQEVKRFAHWIERHRKEARPYIARPPGVIREFGEGMVRWLAFQL
jgi:cardiolipin synthase